MKKILCWIGVHDWRYKPSGVTGLDLRYCARCPRSNLQNCNIRIRAGDKLDE